MAKWSIFSIVLILQLLLVVMYQDAPFFWDTIQFAGMHGSYFFENGFSFFLPEHLDSGHPPLFGNLLALTWSIFGKTLMVSHFFMLPFLVLNLFLALKIGEYFTPESPWMFMLLMFVCPFYLGHSILVSPDIILVSGFLLCMYAIIKNSRVSALFGAILLCLISMRGFMVASAFLLFILIKNRNNLRAHFKILTPFFIGILLFVLYQIAHYYNAEWVGFHSDSPWQQSFSFPGVKGLVLNTVVFIWRCLDYGVGALLIAFAVLIYNGQRPNRNLFLLFALLISIMFFATVPFTGLMNHRYFLPIILVFLLMFSQLKIFGNTYLPYVMILLLFAGNFLIYPKHIAQGWDSTLAHIHYYDLEKDMHNYIEELGLDRNEIGTAFPLKNERKYMTLVEGENLKYHDYDLSRHQYIVYSNVMNSFSDLELETLFNTWTKKKQLKTAGVEMILFEKK